MAKNCRLSVAGYGSIRVHAITISHGLEFKTKSDTGSARGSSWVPSKVSESRFLVTVKHGTYEEFVEFNRWLQVYCEKFVSQSGKISPMRVQVGARSFDKIAIPVGGIRFGKGYDEFYWEQRIEFKGTSDALDLTDASDLLQISSAYTSTYRESGQSEGDYLSNYAVAAIGDSLFARESDRLYGINVARPYSGGAH